MDMKKYIEHRVNPQISYFDMQATKSKKCHFYLILFSMILSSTCTILVLIGTKFSELTVILSIFASISTTIVTILLGIDKLGKYQELSTQFKKICEELRQELYLYELSSGQYSGKNKDNLFVQKCESIMVTEVTSWIQSPEQKE